MDLRTDIFEPSALVPDLGHLFGVASSAHLSWLLPIAIVASAIVWFLFRRMRLGYEARAVGSSAGSARAGGIGIGAVQIKLFLISGALAGLTGMRRCSPTRRARPDYEAQLGFTGARSLPRPEQPIGIVFAAILGRSSREGDRSADRDERPERVVIILQGIRSSAWCRVSVAKRRLARRELQRAGA